MLIGERLTALAHGRSGHVLGTVPGTWPEQTVAAPAGGERPFRGLRNSGSASADPESCDDQKNEPPPLRQGGGSGRKAGPAGGTAPVWGRGHVLGYRDAAPRETLRGSKTFVATSVRAPVSCSEGG